MPVSDFDIQRLAHLFIQLDDEQATAKGDAPQGGSGDRNKWLRILVAIGELEEPPTDAQH